MPKFDHCITCGSPIPEGQKHPHYFAQDALRNATAADLAGEVHTMCESLEALCDAIIELSDKDPMDDDMKKTLSGLYMLSWDLGREIAQRAETAHGEWLTS